jgi:hypothetical protein
VEVEDKATVIVSELWTVVRTNVDVLGITLEPVETGRAIAVVMLMRDIESPDERVVEGVEEVDN